MEKGSQIIKALIVEDSDIIREILKRLLSEVNVAEIIGEAMEKVESLCSEVIMSDIYIPGEGVKACKLATGQRTG